MSLDSRVADAEERSGCGFDASAAGPLQAFLHFRLNCRLTYNLGPSFSSNNIPVPGHKNCKANGAQGFPDENAPVWMEGVVTHFNTGGGV